MELRLPLEMSPGREAACRAVFGTWVFFPNDARKNCPFVLTAFTGGSSERCPGIGFLSRGDREIGVLRNVEPPTRPRLECLRLDRPHPEVRPEGREPLPDKAGESTLLSRSGGEKGLRGGGAGKPRCSSRGRPGFRGTLWVASRVPSALSTSNS